MMGIGMVTASGRGIGNVGWNGYLIGEELHKTV